MSKDDNFPKRLPLAIEPSNRDSTSAKDARLVNAYTETMPNGDGTYVIKRPGMTINAAQSYGIPGVGKGIFTAFSDVFQVVGDKLIKNGSTVLGTVDNTLGATYFFSSNLTFIILGNGIKSYAWSPIGGFVIIPPGPTQRGFVYLDGTTYYTDQFASIFGSHIQDPTIWDPVNVISAQIETGNAIVLMKHLIYVLVFKQYSVEVFYDNGNPTGSPLAPNLGAKMNMGCASDKSALEIGGDIYWISTSRSGSPSVYMITGLTPTQISTAAIDKLIEASNFGAVYSWNYKGEGHNFYIITMVDINLTLAYDIVEQSWAQWTDVNGNYVPIASSTYLGNTIIAQHVSDGNVYTVSQAAYTDYGNLIPVDIYTPEFDGKVDRRKVLNLMRFNTDQTNGSVLQVRCNDQNYQSNKWTNFRRVDLGTARPFLTNCGTFYKRAYHLRHKANTPLRIYSVDIAVDIGTL